MGFEDFSAVPAPAGPHLHSYVTMLMLSMRTARSIVFRAALENSSLVSLGMKRMHPMKNPEILEPNHITPPKSHHTGISSEVSAADPDSTGPPL